mmetsp:Transcript_13562/g.25587  ORF Transcript_13562/g.25587 Transcript_13562/m.25587 type:complete len:117 (-) Transcript_13562:260-610(-)
MKDIFTEIINEAQIGIQVVKIPQYIFLAVEGRIQRWGKVVSSSARVEVDLVVFYEQPETLKSSDSTSIMHWGYPTLKALFRSHTWRVAEYAIGLRDIVRVECDPKGVVNRKKLMFT